MEDVLHLLHISPQSELYSRLVSQRLFCITRNKQEYIHWNQLACSVNFI